MRYFILSATFAGLVAGSGLVSPVALAQDMAGPQEEPKQEEGDKGDQDAKKGKKAAKKAAKKADKERNRRRGMNVERYVKQVTEALTLNEEQVAQLRTILTANVEAADQVRSEAEAKNKELEASRDQKIRELLTEEQAAKFDQLQAEREERRGGREGRARRGERGPGGPGGPGGRMAGGRGLLGFDPRQVLGELALSEEQQAQARDIMRDVMGGLREQIGAARQQGPEAMQAAMAEIREKVKAQLSGILDEEQKARFNELTAEGAAAPKGERAGRERGRRQPRTPEERMERRLAAVLEAMQLTEDEVMILEPQIKRILKLDADTGATAEAERKALEELLKAEGEVDGDGIRARMAALRKVREEQQEARGELEKELRELVTIKQEGMLFLHRVLR
ncbi:MAG: hypothetical protein ACYTGX_10380 [Planctomycetota bacterium]|jgi:Spy/CpxP family protein refolding chaperone